MKKLFLLTAVGMFCFCGEALAKPPLLPQAAPLNFNPPKGRRYEFPNGLILYLLQDNSIPSVRAKILLKAGKLHSPKERAGLTEIMVQSMRSAGTAKYNAEDINKTLDYLGAYIEAGQNKEMAEFNMFALSKDATQVLDIFADMVISPRFDAEKVQIEKEGLIGYIARRNDDPLTMAIREAQRKYFGPSSGFGMRPEKTSVEALSRDELAAFHRAHIRPDSVIAIITGDFDSSKILAWANSRLGAWENPPVKYYWLWGLVPAKLKREVYFIDKDVESAPVILVQRGPARGDPDEYNMRVLDEILGANSWARMFLEIRTLRGLAYMASTFWGDFEGTGVYGAYSSTKNNSVGQVAGEMINQMNKIKSEIVPEEELSRAKDGIVNSYIFNFTTAMGIMYNGRALPEFYGREEGYAEKYPEKIKAVTAQNVLDTAKKWLWPERAVIFAVGRSAEFKKDLEAFGAPEEVKAD
ncbi:MAG: pitrilysin family protein [Elusimicrobia bacterium]|nr:pitrilysin family protein [Elusimicrobiota bacterium]